jgi:hypothetical protein
MLQQKFQKLEVKLCDKSHCELSAWTRVSPSRIGFSDSAVVIKKEGEGDTHSLPLDHPFER